MPQIYFKHLRVGFGIATLAIFGAYDRSTSGQDVHTEHSGLHAPGMTSAAQPAQTDRPGLLSRPPAQLVPTITPVAASDGPLDEGDRDPPLGFTGPTGVLPSEVQQDGHFVPMDDRWRTGFPEWDRYGNGHPWLDDYPYVEGHWWDPYNQNVLKGDYPVIGQHTFFKFTAVSLSVFDLRQVPTGTTPFESTVGPFAQEFFGDPDQFVFLHNLKLSFDLNHGDAAFKPLDWQVKVEPVFNFNYLDVQELAVVRPNVLKGTTRARDDFALEEWFLERKVADLSPYYDFMSLRAGSQFFVSDFRGFIFSDVNRAVRLFGTRLSGRDQFNWIWFDQTEKDTNSELNTFDDRHQNVLIANYYRQDFIWPGYTAQLSFHWNRDKPGFRFDDNDFLVRPDPAGVFQQHEINAYYIGWAGDGHIGRYNINHAFYWVLGRDQLNPLAGHEVDINAHMVAIELSYDRDWARFRASLFYSSGDDDIADDDAEGFDSIFDNPNFAGGEFSYWNRQAIRLFGVNLVNRLSLVPELRSSKTQGQSNFVNPGLLLLNLGADMDLTPKLKIIGNVNFLWFDHTDVLREFTFQQDIDRRIGTDLSLGVEYRPLLNNNVIVVAGTSALLPGAGFEDLYREFDSARVSDSNQLFAGFLEVILEY